MQAQAGESLIDRTLPPYPQGLNSLQGTCLPGEEGLVHVCDYAISVLGHGAFGDDADPVSVVAERNPDHPAHVHWEPRWLITDVLPYPEAGDGYFLQVGSCRVEGRDDGYVAALVRHDDASPYSTDVTWARRLDTDRGRLERVDPGRVDCPNEYYGE